MTLHRVVANARRAIAFAKHMPPHKLARRVELDVRRRLRDRLNIGDFVLPPSPPLSKAPPLPVFAPRVNALAKTEYGLALTFLGREVIMPGMRVDWSQPGDSDSDQLWRMNLHYMEYLEAASDADLIEVVRDWIGGNLPARPKAWRDSWSSYALSIRVVVLMQQMAARGQIFDDIHRSIAQQLCFLEHNLETDLGGNHLIKNIKALIWASAYFNGRDAERWRRIGLRLLTRELDRQILPDGMHCERSPSYHSQVFADLLECRHALGADPLGGQLDRALHRMSAVAADLAHPDGGVALFNDAGLAMAYAPAECLDVYERLFGRRPTAREFFAYADAGYFGMRYAASYLVVDCGRIAPDDLPAHGHGDVLSFEWSVGTQRVFVDQGVFEYTPGERRKAARSAAGHNTLCLSDADQADFFGAFRCGRRPNVEVRRCKARSGGFVLEGVHDGFCHLPGRPHHVRRFEASPKRLRILDRVEGCADRPARIGFLLHPDVAVDTEGNVVRLSWPGASIIMQTSQPLAIEGAVWWPDMGHERKTCRLVISPPTGALAVDTIMAIEGQEAFA